MVVDNRFYRQPCKNRVPPGQQEGMPKAADPPIAIGEGVNQLQFIMKYAASDQHMKIAVPGPFQQLQNQIRDILRQCAEMQDIALLIYNANGSGAELPSFFYQPMHHHAVGRQKVMDGVGIQFIQPFIDFIGIFDFRNIFGRC